tara:strand:- start:890 stop:1153 length:264 start_codon:yes stop_codon:yes gene_type:complete
MGSISGFKEYVDKNHPACPLCGGATEKKRFTDDEKDPNTPSANWGGTADYPNLSTSGSSNIVGGSIRECVNCGAQHDKDGKILKESN